MWDLDTIVRINKGDAPLPFHVILRNHETYSTEKKNSTSASVEETKAPSRAICRAKVNVPEGAAGLRGMRCKCKHGCSS